MALFFWWGEVKLHMVINKTSDVQVFTTKKGNIDYRKPVPNLTEKLSVYFGLLSVFNGLWSKWTFPRSSLTAVWNLLPRWKGGMKNINFANWEGKKFRRWCCFWLPKSRLEIEHTRDRCHIIFLVHICSTLISIQFPIISTFINTEFAIIVCPQMPSCGLSSLLNHNSSFW